MNKRKIDHIRESAFWMDVEDSDDLSPIREMITLRDRMLIVKEASIWQAQLADSVDPGRTNVKIPHTQQKLLGRGTGDPIVCRTLLQAKRLLKPEFLLSNDRVADGMDIALTYLLEVAELDGKSAAFVSLCELLKKEFDGSSQKGNGIKIPAVGDVQARGKTFVQLADHAVRTLWTFVRVFKPTLPVGVSWQNLEKELGSIGAPDKEMAGLVRELSIGFRALRNTRNAIEHPKADQMVVFQDYKMKADGIVHLPTISLIEKDTPLPETQLAAFFARVIDFLVHAFEEILLNFCALNVKSVAGLETVLIELDQDQRRYPDLAYCYASKVGGQIMPHID